MNLSKSLKSQQVISPASKLVARNRLAGSQKQNPKTKGKRRTKVVRIAKK